MKHHAELFDALSDIFIDSIEAQELIELETRFGTQLILQRQERIKDPLIKSLVVVHAITEDGMHCTLCAVPFPCVTVKLIDQHAHHGDGLAGSGRR